MDSTLPSQEVFYILKKDVNQKMIFFCRILWYVIIEVQKTPTQTRKPLGRAGQSLGKKLCLGIQM